MASQSNTRLVGGWQQALPPLRDSSQPFLEILPLLSKLCSPSAKLQGGDENTAQGDQTSIQLHIAV
jgi:hypothetical protein